MMEIQLKTVEDLLASPSYDEQQTALERTSVHAAVAVFSHLSLSKRTLL